MCPARKADSLQTEITSLDSKTGMAEAMRNKWEISELAETWLHCYYRHDYKKRNKVLKKKEKEKEKRATYILFMC